MGVHRRGQRSNVLSTRNPATEQPLCEIDIPMTVPEVAEFLRTSPKAVYTMVSRGQLPGVLRINRRVLFNQRALLHWIRQKSTPSGE